METEEILAAIQKAAETIATPNWASILSALAACGAVVVAVIIAFKQIAIAKKQNEITEKQADIAEQQNKIAVFDKRYELYLATSKCVSLENFITTLFEGKDITIDDIHLLFAIAVKEPSDDLKSINAFQEASNVCARLEQSEFLFPQNISDHLSKLSECLLQLILADAPANQNTSINELRKNYCQAVNSLKTDGILQEIKDSMYLS